MKSPLPHLLTAALAALPALTTRTAAQHDPLRFYVSGYDGAIRTFDFDPLSKAATQVSLLDLGTTASPSWLHFRYSILPSRKLEAIYAADESDPGRILVLGARNASGSLSVKQTGATGAGPVALVPAGGHFDSSCLFTADYSAGRITVHDLNPITGGLTRPPTPALYFAFSASGPGPVPSRQSQSYIHQVVRDPSGRFIYAPDLGLDEIHVIAVPRSHAHTLSSVFGTGICRHAHSVPWGSVKAPPGSGPRHIAFHADKERNLTNAYLTSELANTITAFRQDPATGTLTRVGEPILALPPGTPYDGYSDTAPNVSELALTPDGLFVLVGCRNQPDKTDRIAVFRRSLDDGSLSWVDWYPTDGQTLRHFSLSRDKEARWVVAGNQGSGSVIIFARNATSGALTREVFLTDLGQPAFTGFA